MATKTLRGYIREVGTGTGQAAITVSAKKHNGGTTVTTDATDANGLFEIDHDTLGYPGPIYWTGTDGSTTVIRSGNVTGQVDGLYYLSDLPDALQGLGLGVMPNIGSELAVSADGTDMNVDIAAGLMIHKDGLPYLLEAATAVTMTAADASNPRIDTIVVTLTREGQTDQGAITVTKVDGTAAASPVAPTLTQSAATWQYPLADILVGTGVVTIAADKVTDRRTYCLGWPTSVTASAFVTTDADGQITFDALIDPALVGTGVVSETEFNYLNGVTSAIQTQIDGKVADFTQRLGCTVNLGNGTDVITSSEPPVFVEIPETCTVVRWMVEGNASGSITINVAKADAGSTTYADIDGTDPPLLSSAQTNASTTLTGWTTAITARDKLKFTVTGTPTTVVRVAVAIEFTKSRA